MLTDYEPVAAYDQIAPVYARLAERNRAYHEAVDRVVISRVPPGSRTLLDVGAGDGTRTRGIARATGLTEVLLEPSAGMRGSRTGVTVWPIRAEELSHKHERFDVITCLWNVLGHIFPAAARLEVLRQLARLVSPTGVILIDVNHRYNARYYGGLATAWRVLRDRMAPDVRNGDVRVSWDVGGIQCTTPGHVFTSKEMEQMAEGAGLMMAKRWVIDYRSGELRRRVWDGNLLYELRTSHTSSISPSVKRLKNGSAKA